MPLMHPSKAALECCIVASGPAGSDAAPRPARPTPRFRAGVRAPSRDAGQRRARFLPADTPPAHTPGWPGRPTRWAGRRPEVRPC